MILEAFAIALVSFLCVVWDTKGKIDIGKTLLITGAGTILGGFVLWGLFYLILPAFVGVWGGWFRVTWFFILLGSAICFLMSAGASDKRGMALQCLKFGAVLLTLGIILVTPYQYANDLYNIPQVTEVSNISAPNGVLDPINIRHVRLVDQDLAYSLAQNIIGGSGNNLGSIYEVEKDEIHIQIVKGHEYWVAPLEFQGYFKWSSERISPAFIMIDAENPLAEAKMYRGYNMAYMPSAYWRHNLQRHIYSHGYSKVKLEDFTFEVTDELVPRWTVSVTKPTINNDGYVVKSVLEVNPETGEIKEHPVGKVPVWIDRVTPERIAIDYATWKGALADGWWNAYGIFVTHKNVNEVTTVKREDDTTQEMFLVYGSDNNPYWFSGMTSPSSKDQSLTSIVLVDARNPKRMIRITMTGGNEQAALDAVNAEFSQFPDRYGTALIPYNIYGVLTYIVPIDSHKDSGNIFQGVAFFDAVTKQAIVGDTKEQALQAYKEYLTTKNVAIALTSESDQKTIAGSVNRIGQMTSLGRSSFNIWLDSSDAIFSVNPNLFPAVVLTDTNDRVNMTYIDTGDSVLEVSAFYNDNVKVRVGKEQAALDQETAILEEQKETNWDVQQDLTDQIENLRKG